MDGLLEHGVSVFLGFFAIMNPIANTPVFVGLTSNLDSSQQKNTAFRALLISFIIIVVFSILGKAIFTLFGITLPALRITGGILVFLIGYQMLHGESSDLHKPKSATDSDISVSPLAVPILAGPGTISTAMNYAAAGGWIEIIITISAFAVLCIITYLFFISGQRIVSFIGSKGISIVTRVMGLILAVIGTQLVIAGVYDAVREFNQI
jgi:multiple antibiotic resistance protein